MLATADAANRGAAQEEKFDFSVLTDEQLTQLQALMDTALDADSNKPSEG